MNTQNTTYSPPFILALILTAYLLAASLFALLTPPWQMPDEPAHYNYIAHIAHEKSLPVLAMGDFDMDYIGQIVGARFPPELSVEPLRYEFYQPPLYYLSAVPIYWLAGGMNDGSEPGDYGHALTGLRLYGVGLGLLSLLLLYWCLAVAFPAKPAIRLGATAFAATLPMHVAVTASVNNDTLAVLLLLAATLVLLRWMRDMLKPPAPRPTTAESSVVVETEPPHTQKDPLLLLGLSLGFGLMTKIYAYAFLPICVLMVVLISWRDSLKPANLKQAIANGGWILLPALLLGMSMWIRNMSLYGLLDPLGLAWHDTVVVGQATTPDWIAEHGWSAYWERAIGFTFRSFWGVFGWLGLFWDWRFYTAVRILSIAVATGLVGLLISIVPGRRWRSSSKLDEGSETTKQFHRWVGLLLVLTLVTVFVSYGFYNLKFVQHQGRYFFWGLLPISTAFALGWRQLMRPGSGLWAELWAGLWAMLVLVGLAIYTLLLGDRNPWTLLITLTMIAVLLLQFLLSLTLSARDNDSSAVNRVGSAKYVPLPIWRLMTRPPLQKAAAIIQPLVWAMPFSLLFVLSIITVFNYIIPQLNP